MTGLCKQNACLDGAAFALLLTVALFLPRLAIAGESFEAKPKSDWISKLDDPAMQCGNPLSVDLYEGLVKSLAGSNKTADNLNKAKTMGRRLELLVYFDAGSSAIPEDCFPKLQQLSDRAKSKEIGPLLIRSSSLQESSSEIDLAVASQRLQAIKDYFRKDRLARKVLILELSPATVSPVLEHSLKNPRVVEIYSSPAE